MLAYFIEELQKRRESEVDVTEQKTGEQIRAEFKEKLFKERDGKSNEFGPSRAWTAADLEALEELEKKREENRLTRKKERMERAREQLRVRERLKEILDEHGIELAIEGCDGCYSPTVTFIYRGETVVDEEDYFCFDSKNPKVGCDDALEE